MVVVSGRLDTFERDIKIATAGLESRAIAAELARTAREELARAISSGAAPKSYERFVNGQRGLSEDQVTPPGPIVYVFTYWPQIIEMALTELRKRVPVRSGRYAGGFVVLADGKLVTNYETIDADAEVVIFNVRPYTRKMEVGALGKAGTTKGPGARHFFKTRVLLNSRFRGSFVCEDRYLNVRAGLAAGVPYILKGGQPLRAAAQNRMSSAFRAGRATLAQRKDRMPGMPITYPALVINMER